MGQRGIKSAAALAMCKNAIIPWQGEPPWMAEGLERWERVVRFIECLPITSGALAGQMMILRPWQKDIIRRLYQVDSEGRKVVRTAVITLPRKQGKTMLSAALIMAAMGIGPEAEPRGQTFSGANDRSQASLIFAELEAWIYTVEPFTELFNIIRHSKRIECLETGTVYQALSRDGRKAHGLSPGPVFIYDEAAQSPDSTLWDNLSSGTGARVEPLGIIISTQAADDLHWFSQLIDYGRKIQAGDLPPDPSFLLVEYSADMDADPWSPETWAACNPALGDFRDYTELEQYADRARKIPALESVFRNLYLNQRVSADPRFIALEDWKACQEEAEPSGPCYMGLDLASVQDLTSLAAYWPETGAARVWSWLPGDPPLHERAAADRVPFDLWHREGWIEVFPGKTTDMRAVAFKIAELLAGYEVAGIAYDRWRIENLQLLIDDLGVEAPLIPWGQGYKDMSPALEELEKLCIGHTLRTGGNPVLSWCMSNVRVLTDPAGGRKFDKGASRTNRIDAAQALAMAVGLAARHRAEKAPELDFESTLTVL